MNLRYLEELVLQLLEHELACSEIYGTALQYARSPILAEEWRGQLADTLTHLNALRALCLALGIEPGKETAGRVIVRHLGVALIEAMNMSVAAKYPPIAELVAAECIIAAATRAVGTWGLLESCLQEGVCSDHDLLQTCRTIASAARDKCQRAGEHWRSTWATCLAEAEVASVLVP